MTDTEKQVQTEELIRLRTLVDDLLEALRQIAHVGRLAGPGDAGIVAITIAREAIAKAEAALEELQEGQW